MFTLRKLAAILGLTVGAALIAAGCSSSSDDGSSGQAAVEVPASDFQVASPNFTEIRPKVRIPESHTCYAENLSPPLDWSGVPEGTLSFALVGEDVDHHSGAWAHWIIYNIPGDAAGLPEGISTSTEVLPDGTTQGTNDFRNLGYEGPCPPPTIIRWRNDQGGPQPEPAHKYVFTLYALDAKLDLAPGATRSRLADVMKDHILAQVETRGKYQVRAVTPHKQDLGREIEGQLSDKAPETTTATSTSDE